MLVLFSIIFGMMGNISEQAVDAPSGRLQYPGDLGDAGLAVSQEIENETMRAGARLSKNTY